MVSSLCHHLLLETINLTFRTLTSQTILLMTKLFLASVVSSGGTPSSSNLVILHRHHLLLHHHALGHSTTNHLLVLFHLARQEDLVYNLVDALTMFWVHQVWCKQWVEELQSLTSMMLLSSGLLGLDHPSRIQSPQQMQARTRA